MLSTLVMMLCAAPVQRGPVLELQDVHGRKFQPLSVPSGKVGAAIVFVTGDCPISNAYAPEMNRIFAAYAPKGVVFYLAHVDPDLTAAAGAQHAREYGFKCTVLLDSRHLLVRTFGATVTPEAFVLDRKGTVVYQGRIDDRWPSLGVQREPKTRDLRTALDAVVAGRKVPASRTKAVGCLIPNIGK